MSKTISTLIALIAALLLLIASSWLFGGLVGYAYLGFKTVTGWYGM